MKSKNFITSIQRYLKSLKRPSKKTNLQKLHERGETIHSFSFRDATEKDIFELGKLHAITWAQTYDAQKPNIKLRQCQWDKAFKEENDGSWFCILVIAANEKLVGFAKGIITKHESSLEQHGDLNKIYVLNDYQRLGLGKKLFAHVVERFLSKGVNDMTLFGVPQNPSCAFHEAMGGERSYSEKGIFDGCYIWRDLKKLF